MFVGSLGQVLCSHFDTQSQSKDLEKWHLVCAFCGHQNHGGDELRYHIWQHAHQNELDIDDMRRTLRSANRQGAQAKFDANNSMDVDTVTGYGALSVQEDHTMSEVSHNFRDMTVGDMTVGDMTVGDMTVGGWPLSDAQQYIYNPMPYVDNSGYWQQEPSEYDRKVEREAESFFASPEPKEEASAMDEVCARVWGTTSRFTPVDQDQDEAADGQPWMLPGAMLPEAYPVQQQVAVRTHFHNHKCANGSTTIKLETGEPPVCL